MNAKRVTKYNEQTKKLKVFPLNMLSSSEVSVINCTQNKNIRREAHLLLALQGRILGIWPLDAWDDLDQIYYFALYSSSHNKKQFKLMPW